ncbi:SCO family protein [Roseiterribacter gracilis]|uniref:Photosynthetic protein synthase I n=1 Tax=Roseiterribacter gracilis TaxID=2812848 RepID=A0A8S8XBC1_9PROT|nr:photosynthetic protein synthase I [Rhodospirillales bacterium TMPK1]
MASRRPTAHLILPRVIFALFGLGLLVAIVTAWKLTDRSVGGAGGVGGELRLVDQDGRPTDEASFKGRWRLVYFGYTFCPDVCPTELQTMTDAMDELGPKAEQVQPIFVTIDPARDTPEKLKNYVGLFGHRLVGLTGSTAQIQAATRAYRVYYAKSPGADADSYLMDHSSFIYLMKPDATLATVFPAGTPSDALAKGIREAAGF